MKLRNKKTGEILQGLELSVIEYGFGHEWLRDWSYNSIKAFLEDWEDVKENSTAEPLIKDEKIRKAVRAWAEAVEVNDNKVAFNRYSKGFSYMENEGLFSNINFDGRAFNFVDGKLYTIAELCGEEE